MNDESLLPLLFTQLTWPSVLVRERACVAIARLLFNPEAAGYTGAYLLRWLKVQKLESVAILGLLALLRAQIEGVSDPIPVDLIAASLSKPSILSSMLLREYSAGGEAIDLKVCHSGSAPEDFVAEPFFSKYIQAYLPPIYDSWADLIERKGRIKFCTQWAYEWCIARTTVQSELSEKPLNFWLSSSSYKDRYQGVDMPLSEVYRSAFLRALAWAVDVADLSRDRAAFFAGLSCPIDLELWRLEPGRKPSWWPRADDSTGKIDTTAVAIWKSVEGLWQAHAAGDPPWGRDWVLVEASGLVHQGATTYDLEFFGLYQKCIGPEPPDLADLSDWYRGDGYEGNQVSLRYISALRLRGEIENVAPHAKVCESGDWTVVPAAGPVETMFTVPRWQWWRMMRKVWLPVHHLMKSRIEFGCDADAIEVQIDGSVASRWSDWTEALGETLTEGMPSATGQFLLVKRELIEQFESATNSTFCWVCQLTGHHRENTRDVHEQFSDHRTFGARSIVLPR